MAITHKGSQQQANYYFDRGNPEPLDSSMLYEKLSDLQAEIDKGSRSIAFSGMITAVEGDGTNNGPYYVKSDKSTDRIVLKSEADLTYTNTSTYLYNLHSYSHSCYAYVVNSYSYLLDTYNNVKTAYNDLYQFTANAYTNTVTYINAATAYSVEHITHQNTFGVDTSIQPANNKLYVWRGKLSELPTEDKRYDNVLYIVINDDAVTTGKIYPDDAPKTV